MKLIISLLIAVSIACWPGSGKAQEDIAGSVKSSEGKSSIVRDGVETPAVPGLRLHRQDTLKTGEDGTMGVVFRDNATLSLGPSSTIVIDEFLFSPAEGKLGMVTTMVKGTAVFLSGEITKLAPESVKVETPLATIGIRGTRFLVQVDE